MAIEIIPVDALVPVIMIVIGVGGVIEIVTATVIVIVTVTMTAIVTVTVNVTVTATVIATVTATVIVMTDVPLQRMLEEDAERMILIAIAMIIEENPECFRLFMAKIADAMTKRMILKSAANGGTFFAAKKDKLQSKKIH